MRDGFQESEQKDIRRARSGGIKKNPIVMVLLAFIIVILLSPIFKGQIYDWGYDIGHHFGQWLYQLLH